MSIVVTIPKVQTANPTVNIDGQDQTGLASNLHSLIAEETNQGTHRCSLTFKNPGITRRGTGFLINDRRKFDFGKSIEIRAGKPNLSTEIFSGSITAIEGAFPASNMPDITIAAEDHLQKLRLHKNTRTYNEMSDQDIFGLIASEHGLRAQIAIQGPVHPELLQVNQSDWEFLRDRANTVDAEFWMEGTTLHAQSRAKRKAGELTLEYKKKLREFSVSADLRGQYTSLSVTGWDKNAKKTIVSTANESALAGELNDDMSGAKTLQKAFGPRVDKIVDFSPLSQAEADTLSAANYRPTARKFVTAQGAIDGNPRIRVGTHINIQGISNIFNGTYYVTTVRHTYDTQNGYVTTFTLERPGLSKV